MKAEITLDEALIKSTPPLRLKLEHSISLLRRAESLALQYDSDNGFWLGFSGGKDSQALFHLAEIAGVKFKGHFTPTSIDPPQVIRFIRKQYPEVEFEQLHTSIYKEAIKKRIFPLQNKRWCCAIFKEQGGAGKVTLVGVRRQESVQRSKRNEVEISDYKFSGSIDSFDEYRKEQIEKELPHINRDIFAIEKEQTFSCISGKDKIIISPLLDWTSRDVWEFLNKVLRIPHCELYDPPYNRYRIGCICCPEATPAQRARDIALFPYVKKEWIKVAQEFVRCDILSDEQREWLLPQGGRPPKVDPEALFYWWVSGKSWSDFIYVYTHPKLEE